jgi:hypothetical protein
MTREPAKNPAAQSARVCLPSPRATTGANRNELQQHQAYLDSEAQHPIVGYKFGYRDQFGSITDN